VVAHPKYAEVLRDGSKGIWPFFLKQHHLPVQLPSSAELFPDSTHGLCASCEAATLTRSVAPSGTLLCAVSKRHSHKTASPVFRAAKRVFVRPTYTVVAKEKGGTRDLQANWSTRQLVIAHIVRGLLCARKLPVRKRNISAMRLVSLQRFNEMRFKDDPIKLTKLQRWCRTGELPARKIGGEWYVNIVEFDSTKHPVVNDYSASLNEFIERMRNHG